MPKQVLLFTTTILIVLSLAFLMTWAYHRTNVITHVYQFDCVIALTEQFLKENDGRWPQNWAELEIVHVRIANYGQCPWTWHELQNVVEIDFDQGHFYISVRANDINPQYINQKNRSLNTFAKAIRSEVKEDSSKPPSEK